MHMHSFINPEIAEEHKNKGNAFFKEGKFPEALTEARTRTRGVRACACGHAEAGMQLGG
jgi:hypothetical protein